MNMSASTELVIPPQITVDLEHIDQESFENILKEQIELGWPDVTDQEKLFVSKYLIHFKHREAAIEAGLNPDEALSILRGPLINAYVKWCRKSLEAKDVILRDMVIHNWLEILPMLKGEEEVPMVTKEGISVKAKKFHGQELLRAMTELSKISGVTPTEDLTAKKGGTRVILNFQGMQPPGNVEVKEVNSE